MRDINFYSRSKLLQEQQTLESVAIIDERHLISVRFGADAGGDNNRKEVEAPRCICSKLLTKTAVKSLPNGGSICCDHCHDRINDLDCEYAYHCTNTKTTAHSAHGYSECVHCAEHNHNRDEKTDIDDDKEMEKMVVKAEKRILRLQELGMMIESNLEKDINPKTAEAKGRIESKMNELNSITDEGAYGEVERVKDDFKRELVDVVEEYEHKTVELGKKVKQCEMESTEFVVQMKQAQTYLHTKRAAFKSLDSIRNENKNLQNDDRIIINNKKIMNEIKEMETEQSNIIMQVENIELTNVKNKLSGGTIKTDSFEEFENEYKNITEIDNKVNTIVNKMETRMNRLKELNAKIENNLQKDIKPKQKEIINSTNDKVQELDTICDDEKNEISFKDEITQWKTEFNKQPQIISDFIMKNESLQSKLKKCHLELLASYGKIKKKQIDVIATKEAYDKMNDEIEITRLIYKQSKFESNITNHRGQILAMISSPNKYEMATSAKDKTVKLWKINLAQNQKLIPFFSAKVSGIALSLAYNKNGNYLAAGCAYDNGAEGIIIVWGCDNDAQSENKEEEREEKTDDRNDKYSIKCIFSSSAKLRFSKVHCVAWSNDSKYLFSGDTTGIIWIWDFINKTKLARINAHKDVVNNICISPTNDALFSCSLDYTICVFNLKKLNQKKKRKSKRNLKLNRTKRSKTMHKINRRPMMDNSADESSDSNSRKHLRNSSAVSMHTKRNKSTRTVRSRTSSNANKKTRSVYQIPNINTIHSKSVYKINRRPIMDSSDDEHKYNEFYADGENTYRAKQLIKNDKYAFTNVVQTKDGSYIIAASRKLHCWKWSGLNDGNLDKGPRIADNDFEHIECVQILNELVCVSRKGKNKVKIFNAKNGKKVLEKKFKGPVGQVNFLFDNQYCVVCVQKTSGGDTKNNNKNNKKNQKLTYKRPAMYVWNYNQ